MRMQLEAIWHNQNVCRSHQWGIKWPCSDTNIIGEIFLISCMTPCMFQKRKKIHLLFATIYFFKAACEIIFDCIMHMHIESP